MKKEAEANAESDKKTKEEADKVNSADQMIFQTEKQLKEFGDKLSDDKKKPLETSLEELKKAHAAGDLEGIDTHMETLNKAWEAASQDIYAAQQEAAADGGADATGTDSAESSTGEDSKDVEDVDFEEVK